MTGTITLTRGIPASGKTTWAKEWVAEDPENRIRLNRDDLRTMIRGNGGIFDYDTERTITAMQHAAARTAIKAGKDVVVDDTNLNNRFVKEWFKVGPVAFRDFPIDVDTAYMRDAQRQNPVGAAVIKKFGARVGKNGELPAPPVQKTLPADHEFKPYVPDQRMPAAFIFDIDGTLAHINPDNPRSPYDGSRVHEDLVDEHVRQILWDLRLNFYRIIIVSGRDSKYRAVTEAWLAAKEISYDALFMRAEGDSRNDAIVKYEILRGDVAPSYNVCGVFDDRDRVVQMWRAIGVKTYQVAYGDF